MGEAPVYTTATRFRVNDVFAPATYKNDFTSPSASSQESQESNKPALSQQPSKSQSPA